MLSLYRPPSLELVKARKPGSTTITLGVVQAITTHRRATPETGKAHASAERLHQCGPIMRTASITQFALNPDYGISDVAQMRTGFIIG